MIVRLIALAALTAMVADVGSTAKTQYVPQAGAHGSSTFIATRNARGSAANWKAVAAFLARVAP